MAKKKAVAKNKPVAKKKAVAKRKAGARKTISVHPHLAKAIVSLRKFAPAEMEEIRTLSAQTTAAGTASTACFISDTGGEQHCINLPPDVCTGKGGISLPTRCPND
jgi:hypothetical protein